MQTISKFNESLVADAHGLPATIKNKKKMKITLQV
jgi:hypothetical protein